MSVGQYFFKQFRFFRFVILFQNSVGSFSVFSDMVLFFGILFKAWFFPILTVFLQLKAHKFVNLLRMILSELLNFHLLRIVRMSRIVEKKRLSKKCGVLSRNATSVFAGIDVERPKSKKQYLLHEYL